MTPRIVWVHVFRAVMASPMPGILPAAAAAGDVTVNAEGDDAAGFCGVKPPDTEGRTGGGGGPDIGMCDDEVVLFGGSMAIADVIGPRCRPTIAAAGSLAASEGWPAAVPSPVRPSGGPYPAGSRGLGGAIAEEAIARGTVGTCGDEKSTGSEEADGEAPGRSAATSRLEE